MSKTYNKEFTRKICRNGNRNHHNTLLREFHGRSFMRGIWLIKDTRNLFDERGYQSDRMKRMRKCANKKRRIYMKKYTNKMIDLELYADMV